MAAIIQQKLLTIMAHQPYIPPKNAVSFRCLPLPAPPNPPHITHPKHSSNDGAGWISKVVSL